MNKHGKVVCKECGKTIFQGRRPRNLTITYSKCAECCRAEEQQKQKK